mmetsp:Transcript_80144/g.208270  ORF Transcript_80144/g.208270 Transcript_80144/m.208270 type:complete len:214 (-) Transcript_80144:318-959(-)
MHAVGPWLVVTVAIPTGLSGKPVRVLRGVISVTGPGIEEKVRVPVVALAQVAVIAGVGIAQAGLAIHPTLSTCGLLPLEPFAVAANTPPATGVVLVVVVGDRMPERALLMLAVHQRIVAARRGVAVKAPAATAVVGQAVIVVVPRPEQLNVPGVAHAVRLDARAIATVDHEIVGRVGVALFTPRLRSIPATRPPVQEASDGGVARGAQAPLVI